MPRKGQSLSEDAIARMKESKIKRILSKYNWDISEEYKDIIIDNGSRNRKKKFITISEFKIFLESGETFDSMKKKGISKNLIQFFSNFLQSKISLSKEKFIEEYNSGLSLDEIGNRYNITRDDMIFLRQLYEQGAKGAKFINRKNTEVPLNQRQKEILYGSLMGDAGRMSNSSAKFKQCSEQKDYLLWKYKEFESVASKNSLKESSEYDSRYDKFRFYWAFYTHANTDVENILKEFYIDDVKIVTVDILENLTPLSIAVWYMDDGTTDFGMRNVLKYEHNDLPSFKFCTQSFTKEECEMIVNWFKNKYNISSCVGEKMSKGGMKYMIIIDKESNSDFLSIIEPYIIPFFRYKIEFDKNLENRGEELYYHLLKDLRECPLGNEFQLLDMKKQDEFINMFVKYYHCKKFEKILPRVNKQKSEVGKVINYDSSKIIKEDDILFSSIGNNFLMAFFPHFWAAKAKASLSPREIFNNSQYLSEIIREIILENKFPTSKKILRKLKRYRGNKSISGFMPTVAKAIYDKYCPENGRVLDFCSGYGGRLFGAFSSKKVLSYTGIEINFDSYSSLHDLNRSLQLLTGIRKEINVHNQDSILGMKMFSDKLFDFCFTSIPYFDAEEYSQDSGQSFKKFSEYGDWFENYFVKSFIEACRVSKIVAINMANTGSHKIADDFEKYLVSNNIGFVKHFIRIPKFGGGFKKEPIFIVGKSDK